MSYINTVQTKSGWIKVLDPLRTIFAVWVLFSHLEIRTLLIDFLGRETIVQKSIVSLGSTFFCGIAAVIGFFILSGLVIHLPYELGKPFNLKKFYISRITRIFIPLFIACVIKELLGEDYNDLPIWSLICEMIYYIIYPLLRKLNAKGINFKTITFVSYVVAIAILIFYGKVFSALNNPTLNTSYWSLGNYITWIIGLPCWLLGVLLAQWYAKNTILPISQTVVWAFRIAVLISSQVIYQLYFKYNLSIALSLNFLAIFFFFWFKAEIRNAYNADFNYFFLANMSKWSYSLYITHGIAFDLIEMTLIYFSSSILLSVFSKMICAIAFAYLFYLLVEKPSHQLAKKLSS